MRRALTALLMLALLGGQVGMLGALVGRHQARQQMHRRVEAVWASDVDREAVRHLTIPQSKRQSPTSSFARLGEHEFRYRGQLYDIVWEAMRGDVWHVRVIHDRAEEQYLAALAEAMRHAMLLKTSSVPTDSESFLRAPVAQRPPALVPTPLRAPPAPPLRSRSFAPSSRWAHQAPYLEVPHPPPWG